MEFKGPYLDAMIAQNPKMFMGLRKSGRLESHLQEKSKQAHKMLKNLLADKPKGADGWPKNPQEEQIAEEIVRATLIDFPAPLPSQSPEPPDDLPKRRTNGS